MKQIAKLSFALRHLAIAAVVLGASSAWAASHPKLSKELASARKGQWVDVIVQYSGVTDDDVAEAQSAGKPGKSARKLGLVNSVALTVDSGTLSKFENNNRVMHVSLDHQVFETSTTTDFYDQAVNAPYAWSAGYDGTGIGIAVIDSGVTDQGDFSGNYGSRVVFSGNYNNDGVNNAFGHGTHVAGIRGRQRSELHRQRLHQDVQGDCSERKHCSASAFWMEMAWARTATVIAGINAAISMKSQYNIRIMNISLGRPVFRELQARSVVPGGGSGVEGGNRGGGSGGQRWPRQLLQHEGYGTITAPGNDPYVITVGAMKPEGTATRADDLIASYSSKGPTMVDHIVKPDLVAPGNLSFRL